MSTAQRLEKKLNHATFIMTACIHISCILLGTELLKFIRTDSLSEK